jgi:undecaprenyl-diphosphatase
VEHAILGIVQGLTEFLPISSSGHLVVFQYFLGLKSPGVTLEVFLHTATLIAILVFFRRDIRYFFTLKAYDWGKTPLIILIFFATLPALFIGLLFKTKIESLFEGVHYVRLFFIANCFILFSTFFSKGEKQAISIKDAIFIGIGQALALLPGISRSGTTISFALILGINREKAFKFSFLLSIPAVIGATILEGAGGGIEFGYGYIVGFVTALFSGIIALMILKKIVIGGKIYLFGLYTLIIGVLLFLLSC